MDFGDHKKQLDRIIELEEKLLATEQLILTAQQQLLAIFKGLPATAIGDLFGSPKPKQ